MEDNKVGNCLMFFFMFMFDTLIIMRVLSLCCCARKLANLALQNGGHKSTLFVLCSIVDLWFGTLEFPNKNNMSRLSRFELYYIVMFYTSDFLFLFGYSAIELR